jgi:hypothetical protein
MSTHQTQKANEGTLARLQREYPKSQWSCSEISEDPNELDVTFQRYSDDAEDRYVIRNGQAEQI